MLSKCSLFQHFQKFDVMGNALNSFFCTSCDPRKIDISSQCIQKLTSEERPPGKSCEWLSTQKLKCHDEAHSKQNNLTVEYFDSLVTDIETRLKKKQQDLPCPHHAMITCLEDNPNALLNCKDEMDEFIDCVDSIRITTIKQQIEEENKAKKHKRKNE